MFMRVLSAMITADWIDRALRERQQRQLAPLGADRAAQAAPRQVAWVDRRSQVPRSGAWVGGVAGGARGAVVAARPPPDGPGYRGWTGA